MRFRFSQLSFLGWRNLSLELAEGEAVALRGVSGSGKSLLLRALADLIPSEGSVLLNGESREAIEAPQWRRRVGYLASESFWWEETVGEHFEAGPSEKALANLGLPSDAATWPVSRLSMGERQRLGLLRMLDRSPEVLLLDEPTANLDEASAAKVETTILDYIAGQKAAALWVSHDDKQARRVTQRIFRMQDKALEEEATA